MVTVAMEFQCCYVVFLVFGWKVGLTFASIILHCVWYDWKQRSRNVFFHANPSFCQHVTRRYKTVLWRTLTALKFSEEWRWCNRLGPIYTEQWRIQDFPEVGSPTLRRREGAPIYDFAKFPQKLHEIERIRTPRGARPSRSYHRSTTAERQRQRWDNAVMTLRVLHSGLKHTKQQRQQPMLVYGDMVTLENQFQTHSQASQYIPMEVATLALPLTLGVG